LRKAGGRAARAMACAIKKLAVEINNDPARSNHVSIQDRDPRVCPYGGHSLYPPPPGGMQDFFHPTRRCTMKIPTAAILATALFSTAAGAQTFQVTRHGNGFMVQGSDDSVYHYSIAPNGGYLLQKDGESGTYQASPSHGNGYLIQGVDDPKWTLPVIIPPQQ
jgi:hypothetical protein